MPSAHPPEPLLLAPPLTAASMMQAALIPVMAIGSLLIATSAFDHTLSGNYLVLAIIVSLLTFPGRLPKVGTLGGIVSHVLQSWLPIVALLVVLGWATSTLGQFDRRVILTWIVATPFAILAAQLLLPFALPHLMFSTRVKRVAVIVGMGPLGRRLAASIHSSPFSGIRSAGFFDDRVLTREGSDPAGEILGSLDQLAAHVKKHGVDLIFITLPMASQPRILKLLSELRDTTASIYFTPDIFLTDLIQARVDTIGGIPIVAVCETPFYGINGLLKRISDIVLASLILVLISPLLLLIAIAIKLDSPGPVLFKQRRYGLDGREIKVFKFRSMTVLEDSGEIRQATRNDSRITAVGGFLRRTSLDELPQFINVLQGRMSVVGPRPHAVAHNELYRKRINGYMIRHKVRPGITGWAQVNGFRGETNTLEKMQGRIEYDLAYLRNWSLRWDIVIILKTLIVVMKKQNAY